MLSIFNSLKGAPIIKRELKCLDKCKSCCRNKDCDCACHKKHRKSCDCLERKCQCDQRLVKDCVCGEWSVLHGRTQTVFQTDGFKHIFTSGFISYDCGSSDLVIVRFLLGNKQVGSSIKIFEESSVAFSLTRFDRITVECPTLDQGCPGEDACEGEICIISRFPVY